MILSSFPSCQGHLEELYGLLGEAARVLWHVDVLRLR